MGAKPAPLRPSANAISSKPIDARRDFRDPLAKVVSTGLPDLQVPAECRGGTATQSWKGSSRIAPPVPPVLQGSVVNLELLDGRAFGA